MDTRINSGISLVRRGRIITPKFIKESKRYSLAAAEPVLMAMKFVTEGIKGMFFLFKNSLNDESLERYC